MADIIKTWPATVGARKVAQIFSQNGCFAKYYFSLGPGQPHLSIERIWFTWHGRILGYFEVEKIVCNDGSLPSLRSISNEESAWQIRKDAWVAVCKTGCHRLRERVFMDSFRGWHYFDLASYCEKPESKHRI
jgi:hypothetical protein